MKIGEKVWVVYHPLHLKPIENGNFVEAEITGVTREIETTAIGERTKTKYVIQFSFTTDTVEEEKVHKTKSEAAAHALKILEKVIAREKEALAQYEVCAEACRSI